GTKLALFIGPLIPDRDATFRQPTNVCIPAKEPKQLALNRLHRDELRRDPRETLGQVKPHLVTEHRTGSRPGAVRLAITVLQNVAEQIFIGRIHPTSVGQASELREGTVSILIECRSPSGHPAAVNPATQ